MQAITHDNQTACEEGQITPFNDEESFKRKGVQEQVATPLQCLLAESQLSLAQRGASRSLPPDHQAWAGKAPSNLAHWVSQGQWSAQQLLRELGTLERIQ